MPHLIRFGSAALAACCAIGIAVPTVWAQSQSADAPETRANSPDDAAIADRVSASLKAEPNHLYRHVTVSVTKGVVRLGGLAYTNDAISRAKEIASKTPGVSRVENEIHLEREAASPGGT